MTERLAALHRRPGTNALLELHEEARVEVADQPDVREQALHSSSERRDEQMRNAMAAR